MKKLITIIIILLAVLSSYGQRNRTFDRITIRDSAIFTDTTVIINLPSVTNADTAGIAERVFPLDSLNFIQDTTGTGEEGSLKYSNADKSLIIINDIPDFKHNLGYELVKRVYNNSGALIPNGRAVQKSGTYANGTMVSTIKLAGNGSRDSAQVCGVTTVDIPNGAYGIVTIIGDLKFLNTSNLALDKFYLGNAGTFIDTSPPPPARSLLLGCVVYADNDSGIVSLNPREPKYDPSPTYAADSSGIASTVTITTQNEYEYIPVSELVERQTHGFLAVSDSVQVLQDGEYDIDLTMSFGGNPASEVWKYGVFINNVLQFNKTRTTSSSSFGDASITITRELTAGDWISFRIQNTSSTGDPTIQDLGIYIIFSHE